MSAPTGIATEAPVSSTVLLQLRGLWYRLTSRFKESNLERHARRELELAGLYDQDADYGPGAIAGEVMKLVKVLGRGGHSGGSHALVMQIFNRVGNYKTLTPITTDPAEWMNVSEHAGPDGTPIFQNTRQSSCFTNDPAYSWHYDIDEPGRPHHWTRLAATAQAIRDGRNPEGL